MSELQALHDEELFFQIVQSTPDIIEAMDMCRRSVHAVRRKHAEANANGDSEVAFNCARTVERLRNEITYLGQIYDQTNFRKGLYAVLGREAVDAVELYLVQHERYKERQEIARDAGRNSSKPLTDYLKRDEE